MTATIFLTTAIGGFFFRGKQRLWQKEFLHDKADRDQYDDVNHYFLKKNHLFKYLISNQCYNISKKTHKNELTYRPFPRIRLPLHNGQSTHTLHGECIE